MRNRKTQNAEQETANNIRQPMHAKVHAQKSPCKRQQHHDPAVLRHRIKYRRGHRQVVHGMARRKAELVERRNFRLDLRIRRKWPRPLGSKLHKLIQAQRNHHRHQSLRQNRPKRRPAQMQKQHQRKNAPNVAVSQTHIKLEELSRLRRKMPVRPINRHAIIKFSNSLEHRKGKLENKPALGQAPNEFCGHFRTNSQWMIQHTSIYVLGDNPHI